MAPVEAMPKAKAAALRALELDDALAETHVSLGLIRLFFEWDWAGTQSAFNRAIELNPGYSVSRHFYAIYLATVWEKFDDAIAEAKRALGLDPLSLPLHNIVALLLLDAPRYDEATTMWRKMLEVEPKATGADNEIGWAYEIQDKYDEASDAYIQGMVIAGEKEEQIIAFRQLYTSLGINGIREWKVEFFLKKWEERNHWHGDAYAVAVNYARLGDQEQAFA